jgi:hypothetical protein
MTFNMNSVVKAGGLAAGIGLVLALLGKIPFIGCLFVPLICLGVFALPIGAGMAYGYFTPGKETMGQSALGGALAGGFAGFVYGLLNGLLNAATGGIAGAINQIEGMENIPVETTGLGFGSLLFSVCFSVLGGLLFGAIGGVLWPMFQANRGR